MVAWKLFDIQGTPLAGDIPRILLLMPARHYRINGGRKGRDTEHAWVMQLQNPY